MKQVWFCIIGIALFSGLVYSAPGDITPIQKSFTRYSSAFGVITAAKKNATLTFTGNVETDPITKTINIPFQNMTSGGTVTQWTPVLTFETPGDLSTAYSYRYGWYVKHNNVVTLTFMISMSTFTHTTASGNLKITGLPYSSDNITGGYYAGSLQWGGITKSGYTNIISRMEPNSSAIYFIGSGSGVGPSFVAAGDVPTGGNVGLFGTITYFTP